MSTRLSVSGPKSAALFNGAGLRAVNNWLKKAIKRSLQQRGIRVSRIQHADPPSPLLALGIDLMFDVGANVGQFARSAREEGYRNTIVSFEPVAASVAKLSRVAVMGACRPANFPTASPRSCCSGVRPSVMTATPRV